MKHKRFTTLPLTGILIALAGCQADPSPAPEAAAEPSSTGTIVLGYLTEDVTAKISNWRPLTDYLATRLDDFGIGQGKVRVASDLETMAHLLMSGEVDFYFDSFYPATFVGRRAGVRPSLLRRKRPDARSTIFFARADSGVVSLAGLAGRVIALDKRASTTGFMLPLAHLKRGGWKPVEKPGADAVVAADEIGYVFTYGDLNAIHWVINRRVSAAAVDNLTFEEALAQGATGLIVLDETEQVLRDQLVLFRPDMDPALQAAIETLLTSLDESDEGRALLDHLGAVEFSEISQRDEDRLRRAQAFYDLVESM